MLNFFQKQIKKYYKVSGQRYLTEEELAKLLSRSKNLYIRKEGEKGFGRPVSPNDTFEDAWIDITMTLGDEQIALDYARENIVESLDGSYATIEKSAEPFFPKDNTIIIYEIKKENGKIIEINHF